MKILSGNHSQQWRNYVRNQVVASLVGAGETCKHEDGQFYVLACEDCQGFTTERWIDCSQWTLDNVSEHLGHACSGSIQQLEPYGNGNTMQGIGPTLYPSCPHTLLIRLDGETRF